MSSIIVQEPLTPELEHECIERVRRYVGQQPPRVRYELAKQTEWTFGRLAEGDKRCLIGHVGDIRERLGLPPHPNTHVAQYFDMLALHLGLPATVALVQDAIGALK